MRKQKRRIERADKAAARATAEAGDTQPLKAIGALSELADQPPLIGFGIGLLAMGAVRRDARLARAGGRALAAELLATWIKTRIKNRVDRTRPHLLVDQGRYRAEQGETKHHDLNSFPSGHTAGAVAVARAIGRDYPGAAGPAALLAATAAGIQVPRAKHFPSDVVAGVLVGLAAEAIVSAAFRAVERRSTLPAPPA